MNKKRWALLLVGAVLLLGGIAMTIRARRDHEEGPLPFRLGEVIVDDLQVGVRDVGTVEPSLKVDVKSMVSGRVVGLKVREGAFVRKGQLLAEVEPDVQQAQTLSDVRGELQKDQVTYQNAERECQQQEALYKEGLVSYNDYLNAKSNRDLKLEAYKAAKTRYQIVESRGIPISGNVSQQIARVVSPMDGVVIKKGVELGDTITSGVSSFNGGTVVYTVADLKSLMIKVNLNEVDIAKVKVGQPVQIKLDAYPQKAYEGHVRFLSPAAKLLEKIKVFEVEIKLDELSESFRTGMSANVEILGEKREKVASIPLEALQHKKNQTIVYRLKPELGDDDIEFARKGLSGRGKQVWLSENWKNYFDAVPVKAGLATLERVEIMSGLKPGDSVSLEDPTRKQVEKDEE